MKHTTPANKKRWLRSTRYLAFALAVLLLNPGHIFASDHCDTYEPSCGGGICDCGMCDGLAPACGCESDRCGCAKPVKRGLLNRKNPVFYTLDAMAGGIERALGLDRCGTAGCCHGDCSQGQSCCDSGCDGCDSGLVPMDFPSVQPLPADPIPVHPKPVQNTPPRVRQSTPVPTLPTVPPVEPSVPEVVKPEPAQLNPPTDQVPEYADSPVMPDLDNAPNPLDPNTRNQSATPPGSDRQDPSDGRKQPAEDPAPAEIKKPSMQLRPIPNETEPKNEGSIFDTLDDPFNEDDAQVLPRRNPVQPTSLHRMQSSRPSYQPLRPQPYQLQRANRPSSQQAHQTLPGARSLPVPSRPQVIGSGLKPSRTPAPLRPFNPPTSSSRLKPVSHETPVAPRPLSTTGRVLAPYRATR